MSNRYVRINSYFFLPTDLAAEFSSWPEFVAGQEYDVELRSDDEHVWLRFESEEGTPVISVRGVGSGPLFHRVLGTAIHALSAHSDSVMLTRWS
jgi:hypothetical protein